jgi:NAD(P)-dependent dehydrogenase (short-subunit alcohol dehydrogenase family)
MDRFAGKGVVVTGASSGIGRATALAFAREGAQVFATGRNEDRLASVAHESSEGRIHVGRYDVALPTVAKQMISDAIQRLRRVDVLVNNAGIAIMEGILEITETTWHETMNTNLTGAFFASQEAAKHMVNNGGGSIINVASIDAFVAESPQAHYNVSKAGLVLMTQSFAHELGHLGLRCNAIAPGLTMTPMVEEDLEEDGFRRDYTSRIPLRRLSRPEEQAAVILFLASDEASFVNGETIVVDGGHLKGSWYFSHMAPPAH